MNFWSILGIQPTNNLKDIKRAYAKQSKVYHPEDDPENFQRLQKAYQEALAWQKSYSGNEDVGAVIGHKQADGSVVGLVSASQLEDSFKKATDASKSSQDQESIEELELTASLISHCWRPTFVTSWIRNTSKMFGRDVRYVK